AGSIAVLVRVARRTAPLEPAQLGLRPLPRTLALAAVVIGGLALLVLAWLVHPFAQPSIPRELSQQDAVSRMLGDLDPTLVSIGLPAVASLLARAVLAVVVLELLLRGFVLPILVRSLGTPGGIAVVAIVFGAAGPALSGRGALAAPAMLVGA